MKRGRGKKESVEFESIEKEREEREI